MDLITKAFEFSAKIHADQQRTGLRKCPYLYHLMAVAATVGEYGGDEHQVAAALLQDAMEDQGVSYEEIETLFGPLVASYVKRLSDYIGPPTEQKPTWLKRKKDYMDALRHESPELKLISVADKLHNALTTVRDLREQGPIIWNTGRPQGQVLWYYRGILEALRHNWSHPLCDELRVAFKAMGGD